ncbi:MAG: hypothetical protein STHCBS139747_006285 [Sporothrix thermara]
MIHNHYDPAQILWFLRNYWRFSREAMIREWHRTFQDSNFGKSQYQWLKSRYGMKLEWGASLNHPPFPGARPGMTGTENYVPPDIPANPPRATFRTRSDSPAPVLVTAAATAADQNSASHASAMRDHLNSRPVSSSTNAPGSGAGPGQKRRFSGTSHSSVSASTASLEPLSTPTMTPVMPAAGSGTYVFGNNLSRSDDRATPRSFSGSTSYLNGTYSYLGNMAHMSSGSGLASPFMPSNVANTGVLSSSMNPIMSSFAAGQGSSMPSLSGSYSVGASGYGNTGSSQAAACPQMHHIPYSSGHPQQSFQHLTGDYSGQSSSASNMFAIDNGLTALGINLGGDNTGHAFYPGAPTRFAPKFSSSTASPAQPSMPMPGAVSLSDNPSCGSGRAAAAPIPSNAKIIANVMSGSSPMSSIAEAIVSPIISLGQADTGSKRKRAAVEVEVEFQPPKHAKMAPGNDQTDLPSQPDAATSQKEVRESDMRLRQTNGTWYIGEHDGCLIDARHRHDDLGGIYFLDNAAFDKAALNHTSRVSTPTGPSISTASATGPTNHTALVTAHAQVITPTPPGGASVSSVAVFGNSVSAATVTGTGTVIAVDEPVQTTQECPLAQIKAASKTGPGAVSNSTAMPTEMEDYEFNLLTRVGAALSQDSMAIIASSTPAALDDPNSQAVTELGTSVEEADDFSSMVDFDTDYEVAFSGLGTYLSTTTSNNDFVSSVVGPN